MITQEQLKAMQQQYKLSAIKSEGIYCNLIITDYLNKGQSSLAPKAFILGGQPGCGKTNLRNAIEKEIGVEGAVIINSDALREEHPNFKNLQKDHFEHAPVIVDTDASLWLKRLFQDAIAAKKNIIFDQTLGSNISVINTSLQELKNAGYEVTVCMLAIPPIISQLQIYKRYEEQVKQSGKGRFVKKEKHDEIVNNTSKNIQAMHEDKIADTIRIYGRKYERDEKTGEIDIKLVSIYESQQINTQWSNPLNPAIPLQAERSRPFTFEEKHYIKNIAVSTMDMIKGRKDGDIEKFSKEVNIPLIVSLLQAPTKDKGKSKGMGM